MRDQTKGPTFERLTRIVCHFPLNRRPDQRKRNQLHVVLDFIKFLEKTDLTGFSMSSLMDAVFTGYWRDEIHREFERENVVLIFIDHPMDVNNPALWRFLTQIKREIQKLYKRHCGEKEKDVWIVVHAIDRLL